MYSLYTNILSSNISTHSPKSDHIFKAIVDYLELVRINSEPLVHITQGTSWQKKNYTSSENLLHLPIILYGDDFEVNNPLGSNASIQKLCGIYISLPFLQPQMVCQLSFLLILALFHSLDRSSGPSYVRSFESNFQLYEEVHILCDFSLHTWTH